MGKTSSLDWDAGNLAKCQSHGVAIAEIESFFRLRPAYAPDLVHSGAEARFIAVGLTETDRPLFVAFTFREREGRRLIRPISARYMHAKEAQRYAQDGPRPEDG